jgi:hypothetical protein
MPAPAKPVQSATHTPVALITVTVLIMLVLAGLATMIYLTAQPS